jgi:hypothetical protein
VQRSAFSFPASLRKPLGYGGLAKRAVTLTPGSLAGKAPSTARCLGCIVRRADPAPISFWLGAGTR